LCECRRIHTLELELLTILEKKYGLIIETQTSTNMPGSTTTVLYPKEAKFNMVKISMLTVLYID
jgi:hypothetical protein